MDYTIFYKYSYENGEIDRSDNYDLFFSGYDNCQRTKTIFDKVNSDRKFWINFPHYQLNFTGDNVYQCSSYNEDECFIELFDRVSFTPDSKVCIDTTGFIRPHLIFFIISLHRLGINKIDFLYSEPQFYKNAEETRFSGFIEKPELVEGCSSASVITDTANDLLIVTAGYDDKLIAKVSQEKSKIKKKYYILGLPSLQPDMYQESILKLFQAKESIGYRIDRYAPAFDPFVTAQVIDEIVLENSDHSNIYLSPLSTKPQTLGIALYYIWNYKNKPINIIFPDSKRYYAGTAEGIKKTWKYTFELPNV